MYQVCRHKWNGSWTMVAKYESDCSGNHTPHYCPPILWGDQDGCKLSWKYEYAGRFVGMVGFDMHFVVLMTGENAFYILTEHGEIGWVPKTDTIGGEWWEYLKT